MHRFILYTNSSDIFTANDLSGWEPTSPHSKVNVLPRMLWETWSESARTFVWKLNDKTSFSVINKHGEIKCFISKKTVRCRRRRSQVVHITLNIQVKYFTLSIFYFPSWFPSKRFSVHSMLRSWSIWWWLTCSNYKTSISLALPIELISAKALHT